MLKKMLSVLLSIVMLFGIIGAVPMQISAEETEIAETGATSGTTGDCTWTLDGTVLTISGNGNMGEYDVSPSPWGKDITKVIISDGVESIGSYAFSDSKKLKAIYIGESVSFIDSTSFIGCCDSLESITVDADNLWLESSYYNAVYSTTTEPTLYLGCKTTIIPDHIYHIGDYAFCGCTGLTSITIPDSVESIGANAFYGCTGLTSIDIPDSVTSIDAYAFYECQSITNIEIPESVTSINCTAFSFCGSLNSIIVDSFNNNYDSRENCNAIINSETGELILGCKNTSIPSSVRSIGMYAFEGCTYLTSIYIPDSITSIGDYAFYDCQNLDSIEIPDSVISIGTSAFERCTSLKSVNIPKTIKALEGRIFASCTSLTEVNIPRSVTRIGFYAFDYCISLKNVDIPDSVTSIENDAFSCCKSLESITIPESITRIASSLFLGCTSLTYISIPNSVTSIGSYAFNSCANLTSIIIPNSVTSLEGNVFSYCNGLKSVYILNPDTDISHRAFGYYNGMYHFDGITLYGFVGSTAETYVNKYNDIYDIRFIPILGRCSECGTYLHEDNLVIDEAKPAACGEDGLTEGSHCPECGEPFVAQEIVPKLVHIESIPIQENLVNATCTEYGSYDEVVYCTECGEELSRRNIKTTKPLGHKYETVPGRPATCAEEGLTEGERCSRCGDVRVAQETIAKLAHTESDPVTEYTPATCVALGRYDYVVYCSACGEELSRETYRTTPMIDHSYKYVPFKPATYFHTGLTDGMRCEYCGDWLIEPDEIPMLEKEGVFCDVDGDDEVSVLDVTLLLRWLADMNIPIELDEMWADVDDDGELTIIDVTLIQRWLANLKTIDRIGFVFE